MGPDQDQPLANETEEVVLDTNLFLDKQYSKQDVAAFVNGKKVAWPDLKYLQRNLLDHLEKVKSLSQ